MARVIVYSTKNFTKKDAINSRSGIALQEVIDHSTQQASLIISKCAAMQVDDEETGEKKNVTVLITDDGFCYTSISPTVYDCTDDLVDIIDEEGETEVRIRLRKAQKSGRDFLSMFIC